jgi:hypothetical protein
VPAVVVQRSALMGIFNGPSARENCDAIGRNRAIARRAAGFLAMEFCMASP